MNVVSLLLEDPGFLVCAIAAQHSAPTPIHPISQRTLAPQAYSSAYSAPVPLLTHKEPPTQRDSLTHTLSLKHTHILSLPLHHVHMCREFGETREEAAIRERGFAHDTMPVRAISSMGCSRTCWWACQVGSIVNRCVAGGDCCQ
jgi:hypothetical protein